MASEEIHYLPLTELAKRVEAKKISPVELTQLYLDRSEKLGQRLNAYARLTPELALSQAKAAEKEIQRGHYRGPLHGIPYAAKDLLAVKGVPCTWGAKPYANQIFDYDATVIDHLKRTGAVLLGKAAMIELAGGMGYRFASASLQGASKNPWDTKCWTCGSSSGSGAIVAAGLAGFAIGTETWGSIVCPSAFCGVSGLRPTYGRVSRYGAMALAYTLDKLGPLARSAHDCGLVLAALTGPDPLDPSAVNKPFAYPEQGSTRGGRKKFKVGVIKESTDNVQAEVKKNFEESLKVLRRFADIEEGVAFPDLPFS